MFASHMRVSVKNFERKVYGKMLIQGQAQAKAKAKAKYAYVYFGLKTKGRINITDDADFELAAANVADVNASLERSISSMIEVLWI